MNILKGRWRIARIPNSDWYMVVDETGRTCPKYSKNTRASRGTIAYEMDEAQAIADYLNEKEEQN